MVELIGLWTGVVVAITAFVWGLTKLLEALEEFIGRIPKPITKILSYALALAVPNLAIIWGFFYLAGLSPNRLSEPRFFWAMVAQPVAGVSLYGYAWGKWVYPRLRKTLDATRKPTKKRNDASRPPRKDG